MRYHVSFPGLGIDGLSISRVAFYIGNFPVYWYGIIIATALLLCFYLAQKRAPKEGLLVNDLIDGFLITMPLAFIGARLYYVLFALSEFSDNWLKIFDLRSGGLAFYGGIIGALLGIIIVCYVKKIKYLYLLDFFIVYIPLGQALGRWGNFFNQEAFGENTTLPWGMISEGTRTYLANLDASIASVNPDLPVHPTFFYEFVGNLLLFFLLSYYRKSATHKGQIFSLYLVGYGFLRFFVEGLRTDPLFIYGTNLRISQVLSLLMLVLGLSYLLLTSYGKFNYLRKEKGESPYYELLTSPASPTEEVNED